MPKTTKLSLSAAILLASSLAHPGSYPPALNAALQSGLKVDKSFPGPSGLTGWVLSQGQQKHLFFTTADGRTLVVGALVDENGRNLVTQYADKYLPKQSDTEHSALWSEVVAAPAITVGAKGSQSKATLYAFFDPNCIYCYYAEKLLAPYYKQGLTVHWIPVAFLKDDSAGKAAAILQSKEPAATFADNTRLYRKGGIRPAAPTAETSARLQANLVLMRKFQFSGTPSFVWKDKSGNVRTKPGMIRNGDVAAMTGLPLQAHDDPELSRFK